MHLPGQLLLEQAQAQVVAQALVAELARLRVLVQAAVLEPTQVVAQALVEELARLRVLVQAAVLELAPLRVLVQELVLELAPLLARELALELQLELVAVLESPQSQEPAVEPEQARELRVSRQQEQ